MVQLRVPPSGAARLGVGAAFLCAGRGYHVYLSPRRWLSEWEGGVLRHVVGHPVHRRGDGVVVGVSAGGCGGD
jgi:hypothetical protein